jgi:hypothetical protein
MRGALDAPAACGWLLISVFLYVRGRNKALR